MLLEARDEIICIDTERFASEFEFVMICFETVVVFFCFIVVDDKLVEIFTVEAEVVDTISFSGDDAESDDVSFETGL